MKRFYFLKLVILVVLLGWSSIAAFAQCNCSSKYYIPVTVKNLGSSALTDYQVSITVNTAALIAAGKMQASGNDIRFSNNSCTLMPYWIESGINTTSTVIWVKVPSIPASGSTTINMYYGDASASAASDGSATFILFDDFNGSTLDATKWTFVQSGGTATVGGGVCSINTSSYGLVESVSSFAGPYYSECKVNSLSGSYPSIAQADNGNYNSGATMFLSSSTLYFYSTSGSPAYSSSLSNGQSLGSGVGIWSVVRTPSSGFICKWPSGNYTYTGTNANSTANQSSAFGGLSGSPATMVVDWFRARKYDASGTLQTVGTETGNGAGPISGITTFCGSDTTTLLDGTVGGIWTSSNTGVATIDPGSGFLTGVGVGTTSITYTVGACTPAYKSVTIKASPGPMQNFTNIVCSGTSMNLSDVVSGGTWTTTDAGIAAIDASTGALTTLARGTATISYTLSSGCYATKGLTVNLAAKAITGNNSICTGLSTTLSDGTAGGVWTSSNSSASVDPVSGVVTGVSMGSPFITYRIPAGGCYAVFPMTVNTQPAAVTGINVLCSGSSVSLSDASVGGTWTSSDPFHVPVTSGAGVTGIGAGVADISYTLPGGCSSVLTVTVNAVPDPALMSVAPALCVGGTSAVASAQTGGTWSSGNSSVATVDVSGVVTGVAGGTAALKYTFTATGCFTALTATVNALPAVFAVGGGGGYCSGDLAGPHITLSSSALGVSYNLFDGSGVPVATQAGSASSIDFGGWAPLTPTTYTVQAVSAQGCVKDMSGSALITINPLPLVQTLSATDLSSYCFGGTGVHLKLDSSEAGVNYQVSNGGVSGPVVSGTGGSGGVFDLGLYTAGTYTAEAVNAATGCRSTMNGMESVTAVPLPSVYPVVSTSAVTSFCAGGAGVDVSMLNSETGITYSLFRDGSFVTAVTAVAPGALPFGGSQKVSGTYTVIATDSAAGCISNMSGSVNVTVNALPAVQTVSGGGSYCAGSGGRHINLLNSASGVMYILLDGTGTPVDTVLGSSSGLDFGLKTAPGSYSVIAVDGTGCENTMSGTAVITSKSLPNAYVVSGGGPYCSGDKGDTIELEGFDAGTRYQLYRDGVAVGTQKTGVGSKVDFGVFTTPGTYTVTGLNPATACTGNMTGEAVVSINVLPDVHLVTGGGSYCSGDATGVSVKLFPGDAGIDYTLSGNGIAQSTLRGTGAPLEFTGVTLAGTYTIVASNPTSGCFVNMTGSAVVKINPLPVNYTLTGGGSYCAGGAGLPLDNSLSATGISYTLLESGTAVGPVLDGTGTSLSFGVFGAGSYTIRARNLTTGCENTGAGATIIMNALPAAYNVSGSATFCSGDTGRHVFLSMSDVTAIYQLYNGSTMTGTAMTGTADQLDFGGWTTGGTYTVQATDLVTHCTNRMTDSAALTVIAAPSVYPVTVEHIQDTSRCAFDSTGLRMDLGGSELGISYQVYNKYGLPDGTFFNGTGLPIYIGRHNDSGYYKVLATNGSTGCSTMMTDSVLIRIRSTNETSDSIYFASGGSTACSGLPVTLKSKATNGGTAPVYIWSVNGSIAGTDSELIYTPVSGDVVTAVMQSNADCPFPASASSRPLTMTVNPSALPSATITAASVSPVCSGTKITFTARSSFQGSAPHYEWIMNGSPAGTDDTTFSVTATDSMIVFVQLKSSYECRTADYVLSNDLPFAINEPVLPALSISALTPTTVSRGGSVSLQAVVANRGKTAFTYQWYVHGVAQAGETNPTFTHNYFVDNEDVKCVVTSHGACGDLSATESELIRIAGAAGVGNVSTGGGSVHIVPNPNRGVFMVKGTLKATADEEVTLEVTNMLGQVVYSSRVMSHGGVISEQVQLSGSIASGMYILNLRSAGDNEVFHVVIEQ